MLIVVGEMLRSRKCVPASLSLLVLTMHVILFFFDFNNESGIVSALYTLVKFGMCSLFFKRSIM